MSFLKKYKFDPEMSLKHFISSSYLKDSNEFLWMVEHLKDSEFMNSMSFRCKVFTLILFSVECSLKSLVISSSTYTQKAEILYTKNKSHDVVKLFKNVQQQLYGKIKFINKNELKLLEDAHKLGVNVRYNIDVNYISFYSSFIEKIYGTDLLESTVGGEWLVDFWGLSKKLFTIADKSHKRYLSKYSMLTGVHIENHDKRINEFAINIGLKK
ncbi:MAG: hypothetical protein BWY23_01373 [Spirochaetes bacterium ADurb.Bin218]|jgi:uncharacterized protein (UPF0333 family)|nr:hypothetical protein [Spirochaetota bacterium]OQA97749.1 MAG: hypothetical protein BWY23_01373 [Spirochaetes bacterium ADurb.Bin218]HOQ12299.1 hypothetical protein [Spirochaetota bacterium]